MAQTELPTLTSPNFSFLEKHDALLLRYASQAERYLFDDPNTALFKLRQFAEALAQQVAAHVGLYVDSEDNFLEILRRLTEQRYLTPEVAEIFHGLRKAGNKAAHAHYDAQRDALYQLRMAQKLGGWYHRVFGKEKKFKPPPFVPPPDPAQAQQELADELERLRGELLERQQQTTEVIQNAEREAQLRREAEAAAQAAYDEQKVALELAEETEAQLTAERESFQARLAELQTQAASASSATLDSIAVDAQEAAASLDLSEADTRTLIDAQLRAEGWEADSQAMTFKKGVRPQKGKNLAIAEWPTGKGLADYVLFFGLMPVGVVEAKRKRKDVSGAIDQSKRYSEGFELKGDLVSPGGPWNNFKVPFLFAANGRPYLKQIETKSGVWFCDIRQPTNLRRALQGWYSPDGLKELLRQNEQEAHAKLERESFNYGFKLREFQERAILKTEECLKKEQRSILLAMATGTGKTKTCIALVYRLLKTRRFRRVLFLVDRTALGIQATNAFKDTQMENLQTFVNIFELKELGEIEPNPETKVHISTIQAQVQRVLFSDDPPPVDRYDCIVIDECHRGYLLDREMSDTELSFRDQGDYISKYRRVLEHYDAVKIGLTATPALHTTEIFGEPAFQYSYREAVIDGWLVDHEPPVRIVTALAQSGIKWDQGEQLELFDTKTGEIDFARAPDEIKVEVEGFNRKVITRNFNKVVCEELANHIDPTLDEKTLIFCATDHHADIVVDELKKALEAAYGSVEDDAIQKITGAADKPQERIRRYRNERLPNVAVTVDLLTTGIDVPAITNLVFIRRVNSRILYEQMLGRGTRLCPEIDKEAFRIFDAVDLYATLANLTSMKPVVVNPNIKFSSLVDELELTKDPEHQKVIQEQLIAKLRRRVRRMGEKNRDAVETVSGITPAVVASKVASLSPGELAGWFKSHPGLVDILDRKEESKGVSQLVSHHEDELVEVGHGYGKGQKPEDFLEGFSKFLKENLNQIPALLIVTQRPRELTRKQLKELALLLEQEGYGEKKIQVAWRDTTNKDITAGIVGFIRQAALGDPLIPYTDRINRAIANIISNGSWTTPQRKWLERIGKQLQVETIVDREALDRGQFKAQGGFNRINKVFGGKLESILGEISDELWKKAV